jgi:transcriptional regulator with XRE-family HTH domain
LRVRAPGRTFGKVLKEARKAAGISQEELAARTGLDRSFLSRLENARKEPGLTTLLALGPALGTTAHELVKSVEKTLHRK